MNPIIIVTTSHFMQIKGKDNPSMTDEATKESIGTATGTSTHNHGPNIPATSGINNSDVVDRRAGTMDINKSEDNDEIDSLESNNKTNESNGENHESNMEYNGNNPNSHDRKGEDTILYKESCEWDLEFGHGNGRIELTRESRTEFLAAPKEPT